MRRSSAMDVDDVDDDDVDAGRMDVDPRYRAAPQAPRAPPVPAAQEATAVEHAPFDLVPRGADDDATTTTSSQPPTSKSFDFRHGRMPDGVAIVGDPEAVSASALEIQSDQSTALSLAPNASLEVNRTPGQCVPSALSNSSASRQWRCRGSPPC